MQDCCGTIMIDYTVSTTLTLGIAMLIVDEFILKSTEECYYTFMINRIDKKGISIPE